jgi:hypothetical protein
MIIRIENGYSRQSRFGRSLVYMCSFVIVAHSVDIESHTVFQMVETTSYWESCRHVLKGLQEIDNEGKQLPFQVFQVFHDSYT